MNALRKFRQTARPTQPVPSPSTSHESTQLAADPPKSDDSEKSAPADSTPNVFRPDPPPPYAPPSDSKSATAPCHLSTTKDEPPPSDFKSDSLATHSFTTQGQGWFTRKIDTRPSTSTSKCYREDGKFVPRDPFEKLRERDTVILLDNSYSMNTCVQGQKSRWEQACVALQKLADVSVKYDVDGIDIHVLNRTSSWSHGGNLKSSKAVKFFLSQCLVAGNTPLGERVDDILRACFDGWQGRPPNEMKKVSLLVITDGRPTDGNVLEKCLRKFARALDEEGCPQDVLGIQFVQIGDDPGATEYLKKLDNDLRETLPNKAKTRDLVDHVQAHNSGTFDCERLLKALTGGFDKIEDSNDI